MCYCLVLFGVTGPSHYKVSQVFLRGKEFGEIVSIESRVR